MFRLKMNDVSCTTNYNFSLFSTGKQLRQCWKLGDNFEAICIEKDGSKVKFDGKVTTPIGLIYYM